jgi:hypothetical protein
MLNGLDLGLGIDDHAFGIIFLMISCFDPAKKSFRPSPLILARRNVLICPQREPSLRVPSSAFRMDGSGTKMVVSLYGSFGRSALSSFFFDSIVEHGSFGVPLGYRPQLITACDRL